MSTKEVYNLRPAGWETGPKLEAETWRLSTIDACPVCSWQHYILPFRLDDSQRDQVKAVLQQGLERILSEAPFLCSRIEPDADEGLMFVKRHDMTIPFQVQYFDSPEKGHPSFRSIEEAHFAQASMGSHKIWGIESLQWGVRPESQPEARPISCGFAADFVKGGLILSLHFHHYVTDVMGFSHFAHQLADNCKAIMGKAEFPGFDPANIDASRFTKIVPKDELVDGPPLPPPYPHMELASILVHIPRSKAAELKKLATPSKGWISTYDALSAFFWRQLTKIRAPHYKADLSSTPYFGEPVNMRPRIHDPKLPPRFMRNALAGGFSPTAPIKQLTVDEIVAADSLPVVAAYIRALTNSVTQEHVEALMGIIAPIRDKRSISLDLKSLAPLSIWVTSHREADPSGYDFGFGKPKTHRCLWGGDLNNGLVTVYPAVSTDRPDEGVSVTICLEKDLVPKLLEDPEWSRFVEYRGVD